LPIERIKISYGFSNWQLPIGNFLGWLTDPGCFLVKESNSRPGSRQDPVGGFQARFQRVLLATFSIRSHPPSGLVCPVPAGLVTSTHLAPSCCEPGRVSHPRNFGFAISDFGLCGF
jgi:hypothetical protein